MSELEIIQAKLEEIKAITILSTKKVYTVAEAALYLGMAPDYVKKLCKARKIKSYRSSTGKRYREQTFSCFQQYQVTEKTLRQ